MPFYKVLMHGEGIRVGGVAAHQANQQPRVGVYTTRIAWAGTAEKARRSAIQKVARQWSSGSYADANAGAFPTLKIESIERVGMLKALLFKADGHMFYCDETAGS